MPDGRPGGSGFAARRPSSDFSFRERQYSDRSYISKEITMNIYSVLDSDDDEKPKQQAKKAPAAAPAAAPAKGESSFQTSSR
jgi:hypothetical protein